MSVTLMKLIRVTKLCFLAFCCKLCQKMFSTKLLLVNNLHIDSQHFCRCCVKNLFFFFKFKIMSEKKSLISNSHITFQNDTAFKMRIVDKIIDLEKRTADSLRQLQYM
eukprot:TRINITY_DN2930_c0_g1_i2.p6 TRINITY_DN2930_c0_g1~~TRINITY_DN2930_c0_g1_i2.p6  ORF type:complete len:108 (-),score=1.92 TRINITY_DN2930_c0_g1_i2:758-1081(-)